MKIKSINELKETFALNDDDLFVILQGYGADKEIHQKRHLQSVSFGQIKQYLRGLYPNTWDYWKNTSWNAIQEKTWDELRGKA